MHDCVWLPLIVVAGYNEAERWLFIAEKRKSTYILGDDNLEQNLFASQAEI